MNRWRRASWTLRWVVRTWPRGKDRSDPVTWIWKAFRERTTPAGKALGGIWLMILPISVLTHGAFGGAAFALVSAVMVAAWLWTSRSPHLSAFAVLPSRMREGETISVQVSIRGQNGGLPLGAGAWIFRTGDGLEAVGDGALVTPDLSVAGSVMVPLRAVKRGLQVVEGPSVLQYEPLGLFRARALLPARAEVLVLPRACRVVSVENLLRGPCASEFAMALESVSGEEDFVGIRPWRDGDNIRALHHCAWARTGNPAVRETEREAGGGVVLAFSSACETWARRSLMDPAISLAGGMAKFLSDRGALSGFLLDGVWVPLSQQDPVLAVESALARLPGSGGWERRRLSVRTGTLSHPKGPVFAVGFSRGFLDKLPKAKAVRGVWVDWGDENLPAGTLRVNPEQILSGDLRL